MSVIVRSRVDDEKTWLGTISKIDTDNPQTTSNNNGMVSSDSQNSESATNYYFYAARRCLRHAFGTACVC